MRRPTTPCLLLPLAACGAHITGTAETAQDAAVDAATGADAPGDALPLGPWSTPATVAAAATSAYEDDVTLSSNALEMIFAVAGATGKDLYYTSRKAIGAAWAPIEPLPFDSAVASDETPRFSGDDMTLYFASDRNNVAGDLDVYAVSRAMTGSNAAWGKPSPVPGINTGVVEKWFAPCSNGHYVVVQASIDTGTDLLEGTLGGAAPAPIGVLNSASNETGAFLTQDCLTIYFASNRNTRVQIFVSHRKAIDQPWQRPATVDDFKLGGADNQEDPWLSADGRTFAFASDASGSKDVYLSTR